MVIFNDDSVLAELTVAATVAVDEVTVVENDDDDNDGPTASRHFFVNERRRWNTIVVFVVVVVHLLRDPTMLATVATNVLLFIMALDTDRQPRD